MDVTQAHIDGCGLLNDSSLAFAQTLAERGARVSIPTTLNMSPLDPENWRSFGSLAGKAMRTTSTRRARSGRSCRCG